MEGPLSSRWPMNMLALSIRFDIWKYSKSAQGSLCCLSAGESDSCCIALQVTWLFFTPPLFLWSPSLHFTLQTCYNLRFMLWPTQIPVPYVQVAENYCIGTWNPWYFRAFINSYFLLGPEPQPVPESPPPPSPARFEQPLPFTLLNIICIISDSLWERAQRQMEDLNLWLVGGLGGLGGPEM